jgi:hypothetical protein
MTGKTNHDFEQAMREAGERYALWASRLDQPILGMAGYGVRDPEDPEGDWLSDAYDTPEAAERAAKEALWRRCGCCCCEWADDGDAESGPSPYISEPDETCPIHGREADPEGWAEAEAMERGYIMSGLQHLLKPKGIDAAADEEMALAFFGFHERRQPEPDDGHNVDRAISDTADTIKALADRDGWPPRHSVKAAEADPAEVGLKQGLVRIDDGTGPYPTGQAPGQPRAPKPDLDGLGNIYMTLGQIDSALTIHLEDAPRWDIDADLASASKSILKAQDHIRLALAAAREATEREER